MQDYYKSINHYVNFGHSRTAKPSQADFHLHERYEIYFFISGDVNYFVDKKVYTLQYGDLLIMNNHEIHKPSFFSDAPYERIVIHFHASLARSLSSASFDLLNCFVNRPAGEHNLFRLNVRQIDEIIKLFGKMEALGEDISNGSDILKLSSFLELLVFINRLFSSTIPSHGEIRSIPEKLVPLLDYIDSNLENDLSLVFLEKQFFINRFYLTRLFKEVTNSSLHEYILYKRISKAKKLLSSGCNVTEACNKSGFNDYSNFLRMFKRTVGVSPGQYQKAHR